MLADEVLHDTHLVDIPVNEAVLDFCNYISGFRPVKLTVFLSQWPLLTLSHVLTIVVFAIQASLPVFLGNLLKMVPLKLHAIDYFVIIIGHLTVLHDLARSTSRLHRADGAAFGSSLRDAALAFFFVRADKRP